MNNENETKNNGKKILTSRKTLLAIGVFLLAVITGVVTSVNTTKKIDAQLSQVEESLSFVKKDETEEAAKDVTGVTVDKTEITTTETISVINNEEFVLPGSQEIIKDYSDSYAVKSNTMNDWRVHNGVDFKAEEGSGVKAIRTGSVIAIYNSNLWGTVVEIDHGAGITARYCGLGKDVKVTANDVVEKGQIIGTVSAIPVEAADGIHLHLEVMKNGKTTDPLELFIEE